MPGRRPPRRPIVDPAAGPGTSVPRDDAPGRDVRYIVRASELGSYAYCRRAWWLRYVAGATPAAAGQARLDQGHARHAAHGRGLLQAAGLRRLAVVCLAAAALVGLIWALGAILVP